MKQAVTPKIRSVGFFLRSENQDARRWERRIRQRIARRHPAVKVEERTAEARIVLGGDGTILEAARIFQRQQPVIMGLNLGEVGFLASVREPRQFPSAVDRFLNGDFWVVKRMMLSAAVLRRGTKVFTTTAFNEVVVQNPIGLALLEVSIGGYPVQRIRGSGVLVSTASGSTAYNLSAHGPVVMPDIKVLVVTELMDHGVPTPSIVVKRNREVAVKVVDYRARGLLSLSENAKPADVILIADGATLFPLEKGDVVAVKRSLRLARFAELEKNYFFRSLRERFAFK